MKTSIFLTVVLLIFSTTLKSQSREQNARNRLEGLIYYLQREDSVSTEDLDKLSTQLLVAEDSTRSRRERAQNWQLIHHYFFDLMGNQDQAFKDRWLQFGGYPLLASYFEHRLPDPTAGPHTSVDLPGRVQQYGTGDIPLIMIPPAGFDNRIFQKFIEIYGGKYKIYTLVLPGYAGVPAYPRPARRNLRKMDWFEHIDRGLQRLLETEKIDKAFFLGNGIGAFVAIRFGLKHPEKTQGIISINGTVNSDLQSVRMPGEKATSEEKKVNLETFFPRAEFVPYPVFQPYASFQSPWSIHSEKMRSMAIESNEGMDLYAHHVYQDQLMAVDMAQELSKLEVPLLALTSVHDELSRYAVFSRTLVISWQKLAMKSKQKPLRLISLKKTRQLPLHDKPNETGQLIGNFVDDPSGYVNAIPPQEVGAINLSPRATVSQTFSNTNVTIDYSRPAAINRQLFGHLIPFDKIWRAGANEGTEMTLSRDTYVDGNLLKKGTYTLFIIPGKQEWTIIFNRIINQWNTSNYEEAYDALRIKVNPLSSKHQERLKYDFENISDLSANLTLHWGNTKVIIPLTESFRTPELPEKIRQFAWNLLLEDTIADGRVPQSSDGKAFYYYHDLKSDSLWFKLETHNPISLINPAISVSIDTDNNQETGANWYGSNRQFKVDLMLSAGPVRQGNGYAGYNGLTDAEGIKNRKWINVISNNLTVYFDPEGRAYYLGLKRKDLGAHSDTINLIGSVGANSMWNDDIGRDGDFATIKLKKQP